MCVALNGFAGVPVKFMLQVWVMLFDTIFGKKKDAEDNIFTEKRYKDAEGKIYILKNLRHKNTTFIAPFLSLSLILPPYSQTWSEFTTIFATFAILAELEKLFTQSCLKFDKKRFHFVKSKLN